MNAFHAGHYEEEFFDRIRENPNEDWPRLQYADWLEEQGRCEHAEYIKLSCELASTPDIDDNTRNKKQTRMRELRIGHSHTWTDFVNITKVFTNIPRVRSRNQHEHKPEVSTWSRGFISAITLPGLEYYSLIAQKIIHALPGLEPEGIRFKTKRPIRLYTLDIEDNTHTWWVAPDYYFRDQSSLPAYLFELLSGSKQGDLITIRKDYPSYQDAVVDLSRAAYRYGRIQLGFQDTPQKGDT